MCVKISVPKKFMFFFARCSCAVPKGGAAEGKIYFNMGKLKQQACRVESQSREAAYIHTNPTQHNNTHFPFVASQRWRHWWTRSCNVTVSGPGEARSLPPRCLAMMFPVATGAGPQSPLTRRRGFCFKASLWSTVSRATVVLAVALLCACQRTQPS